MPSTLKKLASTLQLTRDYSTIPAGIKWRSNTFFIVSTVAVGLFTDMFLYGLVGMLTTASLRTDMTDGFSSDFALHA